MSLHRRRRTRPLSREAYRDPVVGLPKRLPHAIVNLTRAQVLALHRAGLGLAGYFKLYPAMVPALWTTKKICDIGEALQKACYRFGRGTLTDREYVAALIGAVREAKLLVRRR